MCSLLQHGQGFSTLSVPDAWPAVDAQRHRGSWPSHLAVVATMVPLSKLVTSNLRTLRMPSRGHYSREAFVMVGDWRPG